jgi:hypothetical protein
MVHVTDLCHDLVVSILDFATSDYATACAAQQTNKIIRKHVQNLMSKRLHTFAMRNNVWFSFRTRKGMVDALCLVQEQPDMMNENHVLLNLNAIWTLLKDAWKLFDTAAILCPSLSQKSINTKHPLILSESIPRGKQLVFYVERPSMCNMLTYMCTSCCNRIDSGSASFASLMSKHRHKKTAAHFWRNIQVCEPCTSGKY